MAEAPVLTFGRHKGHDLATVAAKYPDYVRWIASDMFSGSKLLKEWALEWSTAHPLPIKGTLTERAKALELHPKKESILQAAGCAFAFAREPLHLSKALQRSLQDLSAVGSSAFGCFFDYLARRIVGEALGVDLHDDRASSILDPTNPNLFQSYYSDCVERFDMLGSYRKYVDVSNATVDVLQDICVVSWCHNMSFGDFNEEGALMLHGKVTTLQAHVPELRSVLIACLERVGQTSDVVLNPVFGAFRIPADGDVRAGGGLLDFKVCKSIREERWMLQLLGYAALAAHNPLPKRVAWIDTVAVLNPLNQSLYVCRIADWSAEDRKTFLTEGLNACISQPPPSKPPSVRPSEDLYAVYTWADIEEKMRSRGRATLGVVKQRTSRYCKALTQKGGRCRLHRSATGKFCHVHAGRNGMLFD